MSGFQELKEGKSNAQVAKTESGTRLARKPVLTQEDVRELFDYDPETGELISKVHRAFVSKGSVAGTISRGYLVVWIKGKLYRLHRVIWLHVYGYLPELDIDHINGIKSDNRLCNLREVSRSCNMRNVSNSKANRSGVKGISLYSVDGKWEAYITINFKRYWLGKYGDFTEAVAHRLAAEQCVGWSGCDDSSPAYQFMQNYLKEVKC